MSQTETIVIDRNGQNNQASSQDDNVPKEALSSSSQRITDHQFDQLANAPSMSRSSSRSSRSLQLLNNSPKHSTLSLQSTTKQAHSTAADLRNSETLNAVQRASAKRLASFTTYPAPTYLATASSPQSPQEPNIGLPDPLSLETRRVPDERLNDFKRTHGRIIGGRLQSFYKKQNALITSLLTNGTDADMEEREREEREAKMRVKIAVWGSLVVNVLLFGLQLVAAIISGSLSIFATMADSFMDLLSNVILALTNRAISRNNIFKYPVGKTRLETAGIIVFSSLMSTVSVQLIIEAARHLAAGPPESEPLHIISIVFVGLALATKFGLYLYCVSLSMYPSPRVLAQDHRNDLFVNSFGLTMSILGNRISWLLDPIGAVVIAIIILLNWARTAWEQIQLIVGKSAPPAFLQRITYLTLTHDPKILSIDTCQAYHAGNNLFVEVDIVMDANTPLWESHDVGESLQKKLEQLEGVERAFVHVDYETSHVQEHRKQA